MSIESGIPSAAGVVGLLADRGFVADSAASYQQAMVEAFQTDAERGAFLRTMCHRKSAGPANQTIALLARDFAAGPILTTNFDHLLEQACVAATDRPVVVSVLGSPSNISDNADAIHIVKLHGDIHYDVTAHSDEEMALHHRWLRRWSQLRFAPESALLVLGHSGLDAPVRALVSDLLSSTDVERVYWGVFAGDAAENVAAVEALQLTCGGPERLSLFRHDGAGTILPELYAALGTPCRTQTLLLPGFQAVTGLIHGSAEVDVDDLSRHAIPQDSKRIRRDLSEVRSSKVQIEVDSGKAERAFRALARVAKEGPTTYVAAFSLDEADTVPSYQSLLQAIAGWIARTTGAVSEATRVHEALPSVEGLQATLVINVAQALHSKMALSAIERLAEFAPSDLRIWVVSDQGAELAGFSAIHYFVRGIALPSSTVGILGHIRRAVDETTMERFLRAEGLGRTVHNLLASQICYRRGGKIVIDRDRWDEPGPAGAHISEALSLTEELAKSSNALEAQNWAADAEALAFKAARVFPLRRTVFGSDALKWLLRAASNWSGASGTAYFLQTLGEVTQVVPERAVEALGASEIGQVRRALAHWPPPPIDWLGQRTHYGPPNSALRLLAHRIDSRILGSPPLNPDSSNRALTAHMQRLEASGAGLAYQFVGWSFDLSSRFANPERFFELLRLAGECSSVLTPSAAAMLDDAAWMMFAQGDETGALSLWESISDTLVANGGSAAVLHLCNFGVAALLSGDEVSASNMLFESVLLSARIGDEGRTWRVGAFLAQMLDTDDRVSGWIDSWLERGHAGDDSSDRVSRALDAAARRGLELSFHRADAS